jgi:polar amino acid transport system permease protein
MAIGVAEMTYATHQIENETFKTFEAFAVASVFYWVFSFLLMALGHRANRWLRPRGSR